MSEVYYREVNSIWPGDDLLAISCMEFHVVRRTPKGVWIKPASGYGRERFVLNGEGRRFAYPTREAARASYIRRKRREIMHAARQHDRAVRYLKLARTMEYGTRSEALHEVRSLDILLPETAE